MARLEYFAVKSVGRRALTWAAAGLMSLMFVRGARARAPSPCRAGRPPEKPYALRTVSRPFKPPSAPPIPPQLFVALGEQTVFFVYVTETQPLASRAAGSGLAIAAFFAIVVRRARRSLGRPTRKQTTFAASTRAHLLTPRSHHPVPLPTHAQTQGVSSFVTLLLLCHSAARVMVLLSIVFIALFVPFVLLLTIEPAGVPLDEVQALWECHWLWGACFGRRVRPPAALTGCLATWRLAAGEAGPAAAAQAPQRQPRTPPGAGGGGGGATSSGGGAGGGAPSSGPLAV